MAFVGITFDGQNVSPKDDGALYAAHYGDGIIDGCSMTLSGDDLVIQSGHIIAGGRVCQVDGATPIDLSERQLSTGYIQVILNYDLSRSEGDQWKESFVESATTTFPALTQDDINGTGTLYQFELAVIQISGGNLTAIYSNIGYSSLVITVGTNGNSLTIIDENRDELGRVYMGATGLYLTKVASGSPRAGISANDTTAYVYGATNNGQINLRPTGNNDSSKQTSITSSGDIEFNGDNISNSKGGIQFVTGNVVLGPKSNGAIVLRPNGVNSNVNQFYIDGNGYIHSSPTYNRSATASANVAIGSGGDFFRATSLRKYKKDIKPITEKDAEKGYELNPISFVSNIEYDDKHKQYGFIAEEVNEVLPNLNTYDGDGEVVGVAYDRVCAILLKQNQMLKARVDALEKRVEKLEGK